jgi:tRNA-Thr(GGU) m(6)t(6)A37 methyltransferase TsaA
MEYLLEPIGVIHTPFNEKSGTPIQSSRSQTTGTVEVFPSYLDGLQDIEGFSHLILLYIFHQSSGYSLQVKPFLDDQLRGLFATRYPCRPNPLGLSVVGLIAREDNLLQVIGVDMLDGTPLVDIKPYMPEFDVYSDVRVGWYENRRFK